MAAKLRHISPQDLQWEESEATKLGDGSYGTVHRARYLGRDVAIKRLHQIFFELAGQANQERVIEFLLEECRLLSRLRHDNIVFLHGVIDAGSPRMCMVTELMDGSLDKRYPASPALTVHDEMTIARHVIGALVYLHSYDRQILHRDVSPKNILLKEDEHGLVVKLADVGLAKVVESSRLSGRVVGSVCPGTLTYMPPEALGKSERAVYSTSLDIYSFAVSMVEVIVRSRPSLLPADRESDLQHVKDKSHPFYPWLCVSLSENPSARPTASALQDSLAAIREQHWYSAVVELRECARQRCAAMGRCTWRDEYYKLLEEKHVGEDETLGQRVRALENQLVAEGERAIRAQREKDEAKERREELESRLMVAERRADREERRANALQEIANTAKLVAASEGDRAAAVGHAATEAERRAVEAAERAEQAEQYASAEKVRAEVKEISARNHQDRAEKAEQRVGELERELAAFALGGSGKFVQTKTDEEGVVWYRPSTGAAGEVRNEKTALVAQPVESWQAKANLKDLPSLVVTPANRCSSAIWMDQLHVAVPSKKLFGKGHNVQLLKYNPLKSTWETIDVPSPPSVLYPSALLVRRDKLLMVTVDWDCSSGMVDQVWELHEEAGVWLHYVKLLEPCQTVALVDDMLVGTGSFGQSQRVRALDLQSQRWSLWPFLPWSSSGGSLHRFGYDLLCLGQTDKYHILAMDYRHMNSLDRQAWAEHASSPLLAWHCGVASTANQLITVGGIHGNQRETNAVRVWTMEQGWSHISEIKQGCTKPSITAHGNTLYSVSGLASTPPYLKTAQSFTFL